jgi:hypothetical protein
MVRILVSVPGFVLSPAAFALAAPAGSLASRYPAGARPNLRGRRRLTGLGWGNRRPSREAG